MYFPSISRELRIFTRSSPFCKNVETGSNTRRIEIQIVEATFNFPGEALTKNWMGRRERGKLSRTAHANLIAPPFLRGRNKCRPVTRFRSSTWPVYRRCPAWSSAHVCSQHTGQTFPKTFISRRKLFPISFIYFPLRYLSLSLSLPLFFLFFFFSYILELEDENNSKWKFDNEIIKLDPSSIIRRKCEGRDMENSNVSAKLVIIGNVEIIQLMIVLDSINVLCNLPSENIYFTVDIYDIWEYNNANVENIVHRYFKRAYDKCQLLLLKDINLPIWIDHIVFIT